MIIEIGNPMQNIKKAILIIIWPNGKDDRSTLLNGTTTRFITSHTKTPYPRPVANRFFERNLILGKIAKKKTVHVRAII